MANGLVEIRPMVLFRIMVAKFADKDVTLAKNEVLEAAPPGQSKVFSVNDDRREGEGILRATVGVAHSLQQDDALAYFAARVIPSPAVLKRPTMMDVSMDNLSEDDQVEECLAIHWVVHVLKPYSQMEEFDLYADHQARVWMSSLLKAPFA